MSNIQVSSGNVVTNFMAEFFAEYVRGDQFYDFTGKGSNNVIVVKSGKQKVSIPLVAKLSGDGVTGSATLDGNEELLANYSYVLDPTYIRNAVRLDKEERDKPNIDLMRAGKDALMSWAIERTRNDKLRALSSVNDGTNIRTIADSGTAYDTSADTWVANNTDRVLFGAAVSNYQAGDFDASLLQIDSTADKLTGAMVRLIRKIARSADPIIRPIRTSNGIETYVLFVGTQAMVDLKADLETLHADSEARGKSNPLYRSGDLYWDNVIIREIPEITSLIAASEHFTGAGASGINVEPAYLCGAQALGFGMGAEPDLIVDKDKDFKFQPGVAVELKHDIDKLVYNNKDHGVVSVFVSGAA